jgi:DNA-binding transcriptional LysR family regulator
LDVPSIDHLRTFVAVAELGSVQRAAHAAGLSRATLLRRMQELQQALGAPELVRRAAGQRTGVLTPEGEELLRRTRVMLTSWDRFWVSAADALAERTRRVRVGTLAGSFDLIGDILVDLRAAFPDVHLEVVEYGDDRLLEALDGGEVDVGFGTLGPEGAPPRLSFRTLGPLPWAVIVPQAWADRFPARLRLRDLDGVPLVVLRTGPARARLEREFAQYADGPLVLDAAFQAGSTPRVVDMVARGFGPAVVSRFRLAFLPAGVVVRPLRDGPAPLVAGVFVRRGARPSPLIRRLIDRAHERFAELSGEG